MQIHKFFFILSTLIFLAASCHRYGSVEINFTLTIDGYPVKFNELIYTNAAENLYQVNEIKYFISKLVLIDVNGKAIEITQDEGIHYVDCGLENTLHWKIDEIPQREYVGVGFVFGLDKTDNISNRFVNPPESNFAWPNHLGGGYHYMQINGFFLDKEEKMQSLNIHTGIGQIYNDNNEVIEFVHNYFTVMLPINLYIDADKIFRILPINMEIQRWFDTPNLYNFDDFGSGIMQNQHAQELLKKNGENVFTAIR
jgi:hypothetical protein